jgi:hypothetical protein
VTKEITIKDIQKWKNHLLKEGGLRKMKIRALK